MLGCQALEINWSTVRLGRRRVNEPKNGIKRSDGAFTYGVERLFERVSPEVAIAEKPAEPQDPLRPGECRPRSLIENARDRNLRQVHLQTPKQMIQGRRSDRRIDDDSHTAAPTVFAKQSWCQTITCASDV
jgi:hypothetical protein